MLPLVTPIKPFDKLGFIGEFVYIETGGASPSPTKLEYVGAKREGEKPSPAREHVASDCRVCKANIEGTA